MKIQTKFHGEQEINVEEIIKFNAGIPGFLDEKEFYILPLEDTPLNVLQSIATKEVAFIITDPFSLFTDYEFDLSQEVKESLKIQTEKDVAVFVILTVKEPFNKTTANLQAPIIINQKNKQGKQYIINNSNYTSRHIIVEPPARQQQEVK
ncbi:flagellar assembly protein FliW [Peribacillus cavernae]|uniref:Flagellar assembly factor FliW n=1 Tax=Peribacillus cavernae TaxID=1674310 RepID=A0A433HSW8_9BACI|nr:flagellar assembly protein FliW [Peribacillus cavernae]MDQ0218417.1 flagellar assembly factor FliW [Peribacillus cavernae]RUQ31419.1 flagellar assembly protein FliW [Peribacillus cavernae]